MFTTSTAAYTMSEIRPAKAVYTRDPKSEQKTE